MALRVYKKARYGVTKQFATAISYVALTVGALVLFWSFYPVISFEIYSRLFLREGVASPIPGVSPILAYSGSKMNDSLLYSQNLRDFTQASLWFPEAEKTFHNEDNEKFLKESEGNPYRSTYEISIPKLNIQNAVVSTTDTDLGKHLVHYIPTSLPGEKGNVVIFGHSTLPQLYNVKDYKTIFTYLPSLNKGDKINVKVIDKQYEYEVYDMYVVKPDQISVLDQHYDDSYLTLVTCVPPGTYWNRLVVKAKATKIPTSL